MFWSSEEFDTNSRNFSSEVRGSSSSGVKMTFINYSLVESINNHSSPPRAAHHRTSPHLKPTLYINIHNHLSILQKPIDNHSPCSRSPNPNYERSRSSTTAIPHRPSNISTPLRVFVYWLQWSSVLEPVRGAPLANRWRF